jgi:hypothetical protein
MPLNRIPDRLDEDAPMCPPFEQSLILPVRQEAHFERHTRQGTRTQDIEMGRTGLGRDHPDIVRQLD